MLATIFRLWDAARHGVHHACARDTRPEPMRFFYAARRVDAPSGAPGLQTSSHFAEKRPIRDGVMTQMLR